MEKQGRLSAVIITYNEEKNIGRCLDSLEGIADEIIVVDSFSKDQTEKICSEKNIKFIQNPFESHIEQKNFAMKQATYNYVISLDADEALNKNLKKSILKEKSKFVYDAYSFNRLTNYCGQWIKYCGWYPDKKIRIWNKKKGKWGGENPHDKVVMVSKTTLKHLHGNILHYSYYNVREHIQQIHFFTDISSKAAFSQGKKTNVFIIIFKPAFKFFRDYILKGGFLDGYYGFVICINSSYEKFLKYLKINELKRNKLNL